MTRIATRTRRAAAATAAVALGLTGVAVSATPAYAADFSVTSLAGDTSPGTLRAAIAAANGAPGADTISFAVTGTITLESALGPVTVNEGLSIVGPGADQLTITHDGVSDIFIVDLTAGNPAGESNFSLSGVTLDGDGFAGRGVKIEDNNIANNVAFSGLVATDFSGVVDGAAILVDQASGNVSISGSEFTDNDAAGWAGGAVSIGNVVGATTITNTLFSGNVADVGGALALVNVNTATLTGSTFTDNETSNAGGAVYASGAIALTIRDSSFSLNEATGNVGGALFEVSVDDTVIESSSFSDNSGRFNGGAIFSVFSDSTTVTDSSFTDNTVDGDGGAIDFNALSTASITGSTFSGNSAEFGGAINHDGTGSEFTVELSTFTNNSAQFGGGAIYVETLFDEFGVMSSTFTSNDAWSLNTESNGGAIRVQTIEADGTLWVQDSTFSDGFVGGGIFGTGGGVSVSVGDVLADAGAFILNSTLYEEAQGARGAFSIGTIATEGIAAVLSTTIVADVALRVGDNQGQAQVYSSILMGDINEIGSEAVTLGSGTPIFAVWSIFSSAVDPAVLNDLGGNQFSVADAGLAPLASNGGPTQTMALLPTSPARDAGDPAYEDSILPFDQRGAGFIRIQGGAVDLGAFEIQAAATLAATGTDINPAVPIGAGALVLLGIAGLALSRRRQQAS